MARGLLALAALLAAAMAGCGHAPRPAAPAPPPPRCEEAWRRVDALLAAGLEAYLEGLRRYAAARDPGISTAGAEARTRERARAWAAVQAPGFAAGCPGWPEPMVRCVIEAGAAPDLHACGLEPLVRAFTDDVVTSHAAAPFDRPAR